MRAPPVVNKLSNSQTVNATDASADTADKIKRSDLPARKRTITICTDNKVASSGTVQLTIASGISAYAVAGAGLLCITATTNGAASAVDHSVDKNTARRNTCIGPRKPRMGACRQSISSGVSNSCRCAVARPSQAATIGHVIRP